MEFKILPIIAFLSVAIVASHAALPSEEYWNSVLPNTPMPKAVKDLLQPTPVITRSYLLRPEWLDDKSTSVGVGNGGVNVNTGNSGRTNSNAGGGGGANANTTHVNIGNKDGSKTVGTHYKEEMMGELPERMAFLYEYSATETQLHDDPNLALFFLEKDLYAGNKMNLYFSKPTNKETFLPRHIADSIPFSSSKLPEIYRKFSVNPGSRNAEAIKKIIRVCEETGVKGEEKLCATSLESMIDFSTSVLGKEVNAVSTHADSTERKVYRVEAVRRMPSEKPVVVCHQQKYAYAVFYCHKTDTTVAYGVSLVGGRGTKAEAVAVCHRNTAEWNPKHVAFQVLKVKPGTLPICHYLPWTEKWATNCFLMYKCHRSMAHQ